MAGGDKFGNIFIVRLCKSISEGAVSRLESIAEYYLGDIITSISITLLSDDQSGPSQSSRSILVYATISGTIGGLVPFLSRQDGNFFTRLEMHMRQRIYTLDDSSSTLARSSLCGRSHMSFRSSYVPVKNVLDGSLLELFSSLSFEQQSTISQDLDRVPEEIIRRIEDLRLAIPF